MITKLNKWQFLKEVQAAPPLEIPADIDIANMKSNTPEYWYNTLNCKELERIYGLPSGILKHMIEKESGGNPKAISPAGARGLFQIMPKHASGFVGDPLNPIESAHFAAKTLKFLGNHFNSWGAALAAYNWGMGNVDRYKRQGYRSFDNMPQETRNYIKQVTRLRAYYN